MFFTFLWLQKVLTTFLKNHVLCLQKSTYNIIFPIFYAYKNMLINIIFSHFFVYKEALITLIFVTFYAIQVNHYSVTIHLSH